MRKIFIIAILILSALYQLPKVQAQTSITVSPSILRVDLSKESNIAQITYKNNSDQPIELTLSAQDFKDLEDGWQVDFLNQKDAQNYKYSLSSWIKFDKKNLLLKPGEKDVILIEIEKDRLTQGGHYASILATVSSKSNNKQVKINGVLTTLLFVRAGIGKVLEEAKIIDFAPLRDDFLSFPKQMFFRFQNTGNTDLTPYGLLVIKDVLGREVARGIVNQDSLITLPESIRRYDVELKKTNFAFIPGPYTATLLLHFGNNDVKETKSDLFFSQGNINYFLAALIVIMLSSSFIIIRNRRKKTNP